MSVYVEYDSEGNISKVLRCKEIDVSANISGDYLTLPKGSMADPLTHKVVAGSLVEKTKEEQTQEYAAKETAGQAKKAARELVLIEKLQPELTRVKTKYPEVIELLKKLDLLPQSIT